MRLTVLVDNNTYTDSYFYGEPALCFYIEENNRKILFDTGYSDIFIKNAEKMGIDLTQIDSLVLSHGHNDHTWGLEFLLKILKDKSSKVSSPELISHPSTFIPKRHKEYEDIGLKFSQDSLSEYFNLNLSTTPLWITEKLVFLGEIKRCNDYENKTPCGQILLNGLQDDYLMEDSALVYKSPKGLVIITGCSHSGICNIIEQAIETCNDDRIYCVIGGFHLLNPSDKILSETLNFMKIINPQNLYACHCVDLNTKIELSKIAAIKEVGVGLTLTFE